LTRREGSGEYEEIRILGLDTPEDEIGPGRSVFADDPSEDLLPHWTEPPAGAGGSIPASRGPNSPRHPGGPTRHRSTTNLSNR